MSTSIKTFDAEFEEEINAWAEASVDTGEMEDSGSEGLRKEFTREEEKECVAKRKDRIERLQGQTK